MKGWGDGCVSFLMGVMEREDVLRCAWGSNTRSRSHLPKVSIFFTHHSLSAFLSLPEPLLNPLEAVRCGAVGFVKAEIFFHSTDGECCTKCEVVSRRRRKGTSAAEEAGLRGGVGFQIWLAYLCCFVRARVRWWKKEPLKKSELGKGGSGRIRTSAVRY